MPAMLLWGRWTAKDTDPAPPSVSRILGYIPPAGRGGEEMSVLNIIKRAGRTKSRVLETSSQHPEERKGAGQDLSSQKSPWEQWLCQLLQCHRMLPYTEVAKSTSHWPPQSFLPQPASPGAGGAAARILLPLASTGLGPGFEYDWFRSLYKIWRRKCSAALNWNDFFFFLLHPSPAGRNKLSLSEFYPYRIMLIPYISAKCRVWLAFSSLKKLWRAVGTADWLKTVQVLIFLSMEPKGYWCSVLWNRGDH